MYCRHTKENKIQLFEYKDCDGGLEPLQLAKNGHSTCVQYNVGEVFVIPRRIWRVEKKDLALRVAKSPWCFTKKALTGVFVGGLFQRLTCRFIGHCLQTWTTRIILLHNFEPPKSTETRSTGALGSIEYDVSS